MFVISPPGATANGFCDGGEIHGTITLHATAESLAEAFYEQYDGEIIHANGRMMSTRDAFPIKELKKMDGFTSRDGRTAHVLKPRSMGDRQRIYAIGHEVLHLLCGSWHDGQAVGWNGIR